MHPAPIFTDSDTEPESMTHVRVSVRFEDRSTEPPVLRRREMQAWVPDPSDTCVRHDLSLVPSFAIPGQLYPVVESGRKQFVFIGVEPEFGSTQTNLPEIAADREAADKFLTDLLVRGVIVQDGSLFVRHYPTATPAR